MMRRACRKLALCLFVLLFVGCTGGRPQAGPTWVLANSEEMKGGARKLTYTDQQGRTKAVQKTLAGRIWQEIISKDGQVISNLGWHEDGTKRHEVLFEGKHCIKDVSWYKGGQKHREYVYENGVCITSLVWYNTGQLSERNVYDRDGNYVAAPRWYPSGQLKYEAVFDNGRVIKRTFYNEDGTVIHSDTGSHENDIQPGNQH